MRIECDRELWKWTVRVNGVFVADYWRKGKAFEMAHRLRVAVTNGDQ